MIREGDIVLCIKEFEKISKIVGKSGIVKGICGDWLGAYYDIEFFQDVDGHDGYGKYGHCWTVREDRVVSLEGAKNVYKNFIFK